MIDDELCRRELAGRLVERSSIADEATGAQWKTWQTTGTTT
jgi:hypothetical protein